jgi:hypothetical protein
MVGTITPVVYGDQRNGSRVLRLHVVSYILGSLCLGALLGLIGLLLVTDGNGKDWTTAVIGVVSLVCSSLELGLVSFPLPEAKWQVPANWRRRLPLEAMATFYGLVLGVGVANRIGVSTFHVAVLWAVLSRNPLLAAGVLSAFGLGRAIPLIWMIRYSKNVGECFSNLELISNFFPIVRALNGLGLVFVGSSFLSAWLVN